MLITSADGMSSEETVITFRFVWTTFCRHLKRCSMIHFSIMSVAVLMVFLLVFLPSRIRREQQIVMKQSDFCCFSVTSY